VSPRPTKPLVRADDPVLVEQRQLALGLEHALDHEHHVRTAGVVLVEDQRGRRLQRPGQQALAEFGDLQPVAQHDGVAADQVDAADVGIEVDADARPLQARRHLLDVGRLARAVIALDHDAAIEGEARQDRQRGVRIEDVALVEIGNALVRLGKGGDLHVDVDAEQVAHADLAIGRSKTGGSGRCVSHRGERLNAQARGRKP
jgi:hypothetical protein